MPARTSASSAAWRSSSRRWTSTVTRGLATLEVPPEADAAEGPAGPGGKEVPIGVARVAWRGDARAAAQHLLVHHELPVVLADRPGPRAEAGVGGVRTEVHCHRAPQSWSSSTACRGCNRSAGA